MRMFTYICVNAMINHSNAYHCALVKFESYIRRRFRLRFFNLKLQRSSAKYLKKFNGFRKKRKWLTLNF